VGATGSLLLAREGARTALLEARRVGSGVSGNTTAKLSSLHGLASPDCRFRRKPNYT
jgi:glycine/D-amino acid oxidase-like deaminating enzyme